MDAQTLDRVHPRDVLANDLERAKPKPNNSLNAPRLSMTAVVPRAEYGAWTVQSSPYRRKINESEVAVCVCTCGTRAEVRCGKLLSGKSTSCGCLDIKQTNNDRLLKTEEKRFWSCVKKGERDDDCWEWSGVFANDGATPILKGRESITAASVSWKLNGGGDGRVYRTCRSPGCCNPLHLTTSKKDTPTAADQRTSSETTTEYRPIYSSPEDEANFLYRKWLIENSEDQSVVAELLESYTKIAEKWAVRHWMKTGMSGNRETFIDDAIQDGMVEILETLKFIDKKSANAAQLIATRVKFATMRSIQFQVRNVKQPDWASGAKSILSEIAKADPSSYRAAMCSNLTDHFEHRLDAPITQKKGSRIGDDGLSRYDFSFPDHGPGPERIAAWMEAVRMVGSSLGKTENRILSMLMHEADMDDICHAVDIKKEKLQSYLIAIARVVNSRIGDHEIECAESGGRIGDGCLGSAPSRSSIPRADERLSRFKRHYDVNSVIESNSKRNGECLIWTGRISKSSGLPVFYAHRGDLRTPFLMRRVVFKVRCGHVEDGDEVHVRCGNKICVEPTHLVAVERGSDRVTGTGS